MAEEDFTERLRQGVARFRRQLFPRRRRLFRQLAREQAPKALFLTCADSRVVPSLITHTGPGELFVERNPGNLVPVYREEAVGVSASIEYAVAVLGVEQIIICGHSDCGVVKGLLHPDKVDGLPAVSRWMESARGAQEALQQRCGQLPEEERLPVLTELNVLAQMDNLDTHPSVRRALQEGRLTVHGWVYHIDSGEVHAYDPTTGSFHLWPAE